MRRVFGTRGESWLRQAERAAPLFARKVPASPRAGARAARHLAPSSRGLPRGALVDRLSRSHSLPLLPSVLAVAPCTCQWLPSQAPPPLSSTHLFPPFSYWLLSFSSFLHATGLNFCPPLPSTGISLFCISKVFSVNHQIFLSSPAPPPSLSPAFYLAPGSSYPRTSILSSRHSREFSSHQNVLFFSSSYSPWIGECAWGGGGDDFELNSQGFYSILLTALLSLFFFA